MDFQITKDMLIIEVIRHNEDLAPVFMNHGMHCIGCLMAHGESIAQAAVVHGVDADALVEALNEELQRLEG